MNIFTEHILQCNQSEPLADANGRIVDLMKDCSRWCILRFTLLLCIVGGDLDVVVKAACLSRRSSRVSQLQRQYSTVQLPHTCAQKWPLSPIHHFITYWANVVFTG